MKKQIQFFVLSALTLMFFPGMVLGAPTIEVTDAADSFVAAVGENFKTTFHFFYSGSGSVPKASIVDSSTPNGIALGNVVREAANSYSVEYSGVPKKEGNFPLTLILSDDSGLAVSKHFTVVVIGFAFTEDNLLNAILNQPYSASIRFAYPGSSRPRIRFYDFPESFQVNYTDVYGENGSFSLRFIPRKTGKYSFKGEVSINSVVVATGKVFTLNVIEFPVSSSKTSGAINAKPVAPKQGTGIKSIPSHSGASSEEVASSSTATGTPESVENQKPEGFFFKLWSWFRSLF